MSDGKNGGGICCGLFIIFFVFIIVAVNWNTIPPLLYWLSILVLSGIIVYEISEAIEKPLRFSGITTGFVSFGIIILLILIVSAGGMSDDASSRSADQWMEKSNANYNQESINSGTPTSSLTTTLTTVPTSSPIESTMLTSKPAGTDPPVPPVGTVVPSGIISIYGKWTREFGSGIKDDLILNEDFTFSMPRYKIKGEWEKVNDPYSKNQFSLILRYKDSLGHEITQLLRYNPRNDELFDPDWVTYTPYKRVIDGSSSNPQISYLMGF